MPDDDEFASVILDEEFVRSALFHEPTARERLLAVADGPAIPPGWSGRSGSTRSDVPELDDDVDFPGADPLYAAGHPYRGSSTRWQRPVAWALCAVMGIGLVALTFLAVYRSAGAGARQPTDPPPSSGSQVGGRGIPAVVGTPAP
jgi:hypothetical protein